MPAGERSECPQGRTAAPPLLLLGSLPVWRGGDGVGEGEGEGEGMRGDEEGGEGGGRKSRQCRAVTEGPQSGGSSSTRGSVCLQGRGRGG